MYTPFLLNKLSNFCTAKEENPYLGRMIVWCKAVVRFLDTVVSVGPCPRERENFKAQYERVLEDGSAEAFVGPIGAPFSQNPPSRVVDPVGSSCRSSC